MTSRLHSVRVSVAVLGVLACASLAAAQWPQFGGPHRNFTIATSGLAERWPEDGPPRLWHRPLGDGYATIIVDAGVLYTMYRTGADEFTVALDAATGRTLWEHKNHAPFTAQMAEYGPGPHSTPLIVGGRLFSIGANMHLHCFEAASGRVVWEQDLRAVHDGEVPGYGYACSPLAYGETIILTLGAREDQEGPLAALSQATGELVWKNAPRPKQTARQADYSAPLLIRVGGADQLVHLTTERVAGFNPADGTELWSHPHLNAQGATATMPVWDGGERLFCSAAYGTGSRLIRLRHHSAVVAAEELWHSGKLRMHHGNAVLIDGLICGSSGDFGPAFFTALDLETGKPAWRVRDFRKATCVYGAGKLILLDEDGELALATVKPGELEVHSRCRVTERVSWTAPTLVGHTLYVRDRRHIMALDVGLGSARAQLGPAEPHVPASGAG